MASEFAVEMQDVLKQFVTPEGGILAAVDHVTMQIKDGEFFSLLGPSGCGKTTSLRMIAGFELPTSGRILIHGREMSQVPAHLRPVNTVFQQYALFPHMTVEQNIGFGLEMKGVGKAERSKRVSEALQMVRLPGMEMRRAKQLSGGQQQRIALARALVNKPEVLLLDEPLGALDLKLRKEMQLELKNLQREVGITFIYVTHDQEEALTMSDRIAVMSKGVALQIGLPEEIYERPANKFVADFIGETNFLDGVVKGQNGSTVEIELPGTGMVRVESSSKVHQRPAGIGRGPTRETPSERRSPGWQQPHRTSRGDHLYRYRYAIWRSFCGRAKGACPRAEPDAGEKIDCRIGR